MEKSPTDAIFEGESNLRDRISEAFSTVILDIIDGKFLEGTSSSREQAEDRTACICCLSSVIEVGLVCSNYSPRERMLMADVVHRLLKIKMKYLSSGLPAAA